MLQRRILIDCFLPPAARTPDSPCLQNHRGLQFGHALPNYPAEGFIPNPLFQNERPTALEQSQVVRVSRLDGPSPELAMGLVTKAISAEQNGLWGRAYLDLRDLKSGAWFLRGEWA